MSDQFNPLAPEPSTVKDADSLVHDVVRLSMLSAQQVDRQSLLRAAPSFIALFEEGLSSFRPAPEALEQALSNIWPRDLLISELDDDYVHRQFEDIKVFDIDSDGFDRQLQFVNDAIAFKAVNKETESVSHSPDGEDSGDEFTIHSEETTTHVFVVISPRVAIKANTVAGNFCDEAWDATLTGEILLSENATQMQSLIRQEMRIQHQDPKELEEKLQTLFGSDYAPVTKPAKTLRP